MIQGIVPPFRERAGADVGLNLMQRGTGPVITGGRVVLIYLDTPSIDVDAFYGAAKAIVEGGYYISPDGSDTSQSTFVGAYRLTSNLSGPVTDAQILALLRQYIAQNTLPAPDGQTLYMVVLPPTLTLDGECSEFCGYHTYDMLNTTPRMYYAILADPGCPGCHGNQTPIQALEMVFSHEYGEWRSDPEFDAWNATASGAESENGDLCAWIPVPWGPDNAYMVQPLYQNATACGSVPAYQAGSPPPPPQPVDLGFVKQAFQNIIAWAQWALGQLP